MGAKEGKEKPRASTIILRLFSLIILLVGVLVLYSAVTSAGELGSFAAIFYAVGVVFLVAGVIPLFAKLQ